MGFFSSRKAEPTPLSLSELNGSSSGSVKVIKSRFYGKSKSATNTTAINNAGSSNSASGSNMSSHINFPASTSSQPIASSSQPQPPRHVSTDPLTTTLAEKLNELALANADGLLDDEAHRLLRQNLFERFAQAEAQTQSTWNDTSTIGSPRKRFSSGYGAGTSNKGAASTWRNSNLVSSLSTTNNQLPNKTLGRAPSIESQRSIATAMSSLFRRATRRSGSSYSRGPYSMDEMSQDSDHLPQDCDIEQHETSSIYSRPSFSSNQHRKNFPYSGAYGSVIRGGGLISRQHSSDSLASVGTGVGSVAGSVAGSVTVAGFPSHLQIHASHSVLGLGPGGVPPSPSSISTGIDLRTLSVSRRMQGNYASSISSRTTSRSNKPPSSFHLRHATSAPVSSSQSQSQPPPPPPPPPLPPIRLSISALVRERSHENDIEDEDLAYGVEVEETDEKKLKDLHTSSSGSKSLKSAAALRAEIEAVEVEGRRMFEAFNALELSVLTKGGRLHNMGGTGIIGPVPEETSVIGHDAGSIKSTKSSSGKDRGGSSASTSGMSGSTVPTIASSFMTGSGSGSTTTSISTSAFSNSAITPTTTSASSSPPNQSLLPPLHPPLHTSHSSPSLSISFLSPSKPNPTSPTSKSKLRLTTHAQNRDDLSNIIQQDMVPAIPVTPPPKRRPSILLQRKKTGKAKVVLPPSIAAASMEIKEEREREREKDGLGEGMTLSATVAIPTASSSSSQTRVTTVTTVSSSTLSPVTDYPSTRVRTRSHSRERPAREKPPPQLQAQHSLPHRSPSPPPPLPTISTIIPKPYAKHPYADTSLALSVTIPDSNSDSQSQHHAGSPVSHSPLTSLTGELAVIRQRRAAVTKRYESRLEFLRAKLKSAEIREMLK